ncbi:MAG: beta-N-acetylhexosaminidase [Oscillospiraceae bacterium]|nr:beta-N-acetylhexosaminidase [Oscillospiraceae bacterium]
METDKRTIRRLGTMVDCSRNAVMTVDAVKEWIDITADMGYNALMLYTEDTYEVAGEPYFGYARGRYSREELKAINAYASAKGMELIPCIQTLAHLNAIARWPAYRRCMDVQDILLAGDERTYTLIGHMFETIAECFTSRCVHIGMDEAHLFGRGRYYDLHGDVDHTAAMLEHLERVAEIGERYGLSLVMWSDMFYRLAAGGEYYAAGAGIDREVGRRIPANVELVYWDYYSTDPARYDRMLQSHAAIKPGTWFAGGLWSWEGFAPHNGYSIRATAVAMEACEKNGVQDVFFTLWGDDGAECSRFALLPSLFYAAQRAGGNRDQADIRRKFEEKFGVSWENFMLLDLPGSPNGDSGSIIDSEKYLLYNDPFQGLLDSTLSGGEGARFARCAQALEAVPDMGRWSGLFRTQRTLCRVLEYKAELGLRTRAAYLAGDRGTLAALAGDYQAAEDRLGEFYEAFRSQWDKENKRWGFEVQDIRLGGLRQRLCHCRKILESYLAGGTDRIEELEEPPLDFTGEGGDFAKKHLMFNSWRETVTAGVL